MGEERDRDPSGLARAAAETPCRDDMGDWTRAAPGLYPHQWSWDSGFTAFGLTRLDTGRAARELFALFASQWRNGKVPHIVVDPEAPPGSYFPGAERLYSEEFLEASGLRRTLPPPTSLGESRFDPRSDWQGPVWPVTAWLMWRLLVREGEAGGAESLRGVASGALPEGGFAEYSEPFTGEALGSDIRSWTAAVALDRLAAGDPPVRAGTKKPRPQGRGRKTYPKSCL